MRDLTRYYDGDHELAFATEKYANTFGRILKTMRENLCRIVVDAPADRMEIINFSGGDDGNPVAEKAWEIWQRCLMELESVNVHKEAFKTGEAYLIVWQDDEGLAEFYPQVSNQCAVIENEITGKTEFAAKMWMAEKKLRLTLYFPDRIEKYITRTDYNSTATTLKTESFIPFESEMEQAVVENPFGVVPVFKFTAETVLENAIPVQDRLNKTICDELVAQEFGAYPQRFATGLEPPINEATGRQELPFQAGVDRLWFTNDKDTSFGQFASADLTQFLKVEDAARLSVARVTGTPLHFFSFTTSNDLSGEALKTLESRFTKRIKRTSISFGAVWARAMTLALQIEGVSADAPLTTQWESPEQRSEKEVLETLLLKQTLGVPEDVLFEEYGYSEEDIARFAELKAAQTNVVANTLGKAFNSGAMNE